LQYNWHRHYDPTLGRYNQADPLGFVDGPSLYGYAKGSPVRVVHPRGLSNDDNIIPSPKPLPPVAGPNSPWDKWAKDKLKKYANWIKKNVGGGSEDDDPCAAEQKRLEAVREQYLDGYRNADPVTQMYLSQNQKPLINEEIADHNQQCLNNKVPYL
jgi:hypothetical protein